jgi:hypothetical protein
MRILTLLSIVFFTMQLDAQSYWFGLRGGVNFMSQRWGSGFSENGGNRDLGLGYNAAAFIESFDESKKGSLYASLGLQQRGSAINFISFNNEFSDRQTFRFSNACLELGAKRPFGLDKEFDPYWTIGLRGEYTVFTNLDKFAQFNTLFYPDDQFLIPFVYGFNFGGGFEAEMSEFVKFFVDLSVQPDLSVQYRQPPVRVPDPFNVGNSINLGLREARNMTIELRVGISFLNKVVIVD